MTNSLSAPAFPTSESDRGLRGQNDYHDDPELAALLSRLAALQGHSLPAFRFGMVEKTADGLEMLSLARSQRAMELWASHFASAQMRAVSEKDRKKGYFPLLWLAHDESRVLLLRGGSV